MSKYICILKTYKKLEYFVWLQEGDIPSIPPDAKRTVYENEAWGWARFSFGDFPLVVYSVTKIDDNK